MSLSDRLSLQSLTKVVVRAKKYILTNFSEDDKKAEVYAETNKVYQNNVINQKDKESFSVFTFHKHFLKVLLELSTNFESTVNAA